MAVIPGEIERNFVNERFETYYVNTFDFHISAVIMNFR